MRELREMSSTAIGGYEGGPYYLSFGCINSKRWNFIIRSKKLEAQFRAKPETVRAFLQIIILLVTLTLL